MEGNHDRPFDPLQAHIAASKPINKSCFIELFSILNEYMNKIHHIHDIEAMFRYKYLFQQCRTEKIRNLSSKFGNIGVEVEKKHKSQA